MSTYTEKKELAQIRKAVRRGDIPNPSVFNAASPREKPKNAEETGLGGSELPDEIRGIKTDVKPKTQEK